MPNAQINAYIRTNEQQICNKIYMHYDTRRRLNETQKEKKTVQKANQREISLIIFIFMHCIYEFECK